MSRFAILQGTPLQPQPTAASSSAAAAALDDLPVEPSSSDDDDDDDDDASASAASPPAAPSPAASPSTATKSGKKKAKSGSKRKASKSGAEGEPANKRKKSSAKSASPDWTTIRQNKWALSYILFFLAPLAKASGAAQKWRYVKTSLKTEFGLTVSSREVSRFGSEANTKGAKGVSDATKLAEWLNDKLGYVFTTDMQKSAETIADYVRKECSPLLDPSGETYHRRTLFARETQGSSAKSLAKVQFLVELNRATKEPSAILFDALAMCAPEFAVSESTVAAFRSMRPLTGHQPSVSGEFNHNFSLPSSKGSGAAASSGASSASSCASAASLAPLRPADLAAASAASPSN